MKHDRRLLASRRGHRRVELKRMLMEPQSALRALMSGIILRVGHDRAAGNLSPSLPL
jgi:hypothetical protein